MDEKKFDSMFDRMLGETREMFLARVLLRVLEKLGRNDSDQEWLELYNSVKPIVDKAYEGRRRPSRGES